MRPRFLLIAAYGGDFRKIYEHIDRSIEAHTEALQRWMRQPSITAQNNGIQETAEMLRGDLERIDFSETALAGE